MRPYVLMVNPWIYDFAAFDLWARPLGLLYLGALLQKAGIQVRLVDCLDRLHPKSEAPKRRKTQAVGTGNWRREIVPPPEPLRGAPRRYARYGMPEQVFLDDIATGPEPDFVLITSSMTYWYLGTHRAIELIRRVRPKARIVLGARDLRPKLRRKFAEHGGGVNARLLEHAALDQAHHTAATRRARMVGALPRRAHEALDFTTWIPVRCTGR